KNSNLSFLSDPSSVSEADGQSGSLGADGSATDAWAAETFDFPDPMVDVYFPQKMGPMMTDEMTVEEWLAIRKEAGLKIDPESAEVNWWYAQVADPYGA